MTDATQQEILEQLKKAADSLRAGRSESELRQELLDAGMRPDSIDEYIDIAVQYNDLTYRRTGFKFFIAGIGFLVAAIVLMLTRLWLIPLAQWPHIALIGCVVAGGINLTLGMWRTILHRDKRAEEAAKRQQERQQARESTLQESQTDG